MKWFCFQLILFPQDKWQKPCFTWKTRATASSAWVNPNLNGMQVRDGTLSGRAFIESRGSWSYSWLRIIQCGPRTRKGNLLVIFYKTCLCLTLQPARFTRSSGTVRWWGYLGHSEHLTHVQYTCWTVTWRAQMQLSNTWLKICKVPLIICTDFSLVCFGLAIYSQLSVFHFYQFTHNLQDYFPG